MRGHEALIAVRDSGRVPSRGVDVHIGRCAPWFDWWREQFPQLAHVWVEPDDRVRRLDMRFVIGLLALVQTPEEAEHGRAIEVARRCAESGARRAVAMSGGRILWDSGAQ